MFVDFDPLDSRFIYLLTQATDGQWYCTGTTGFVTQMTASGSLEEIPQTCFPAAFVVVETETTTTTSTSTTTTTAAP